MFWPSDPGCPVFWPLTRCPVLQEAKREERKKLADEDAIRKIRQLEEHNHVLQKQIHNQKQVQSEV